MVPPAEQLSKHYEFALSLSPKPERAYKEEAAAVAAESSEGTVCIWREKSAASFGGKKKTIFLVLAGSFLRAVELRAPIKSPARILAIPLREAEQ